jgi:hypothetical protein
MLSQYNTVAFLRKLFECCFEYDELLRENKSGREFHVKHFVKSLIRQRHHATPKLGAEILN